MTARVSGWPWLWLETALVLRLSLDWTVILSELNYILVSLCRVSQWTHHIYWGLTHLKYWSCKYLTVQTFHLYIYLGTKQPYSNCHTVHLSNIVFYYPFTLTLLYIKNKKTIKIRKYFRFSECIYQLINSMESNQLRTCIVNFTHKSNNCYTSVTFRGEDLM